MRDLSPHKKEKGVTELRLELLDDMFATGILAKLSKVLAEAQISIFAISTYDTDYILVKADKATEAVAVLKAEGCQFT